MRNVKEIPLNSQSAPERSPLWHRAEVDRLAAELETNGIVVLPTLFSAALMALVHKPQQLWTALALRAVPLTPRAPRRGVLAPSILPA